MAKYCQIKTHSKFNSQQIVSVISNKLKRMKIKFKIVNIWGRFIKLYSNKN